METILLFFAISSLNILCFYAGAKVLQMATKGQDIKLPIKNPMTAIKERQEDKAAEMEQNRMNTILRNIESYDGTARGQEDVPRG